MINVNMIPNMDVPTLHCSQGDTKERKFEVALHNNGKLIDASGFQKPLIFDSFAGGTEKIMGEDTSPIVADIDYPDETRNNQVFLDRQSPSAESGNAEITTIKGNSLVFNQKVWSEENADILKIKGNTVKFNQLVQNGNFADTSNWFFNRGTIVANNNELTYTISEVGSFVYANRIWQRIKWVVGHKYYAKYSIYSGKNFRCYVQLRYNNGAGGSNELKSSIIANKWNDVSGILTATADWNTGDQNYGLWMGFIIQDYSFVVGDTIKIKNVQVFDLTAMGIDNLTTVEQVETWLSNNLGLLPYYDYTLGSLIPFTGTGLKTVGFNQWDEEWEIGMISAEQNTPSNDTIRAKNYIPVISNINYYINIPTNTGIVIFYYDGNKKYITEFLVPSSTLISIPNDVKYIRFRTYIAYGTTYNNDICINISDTSRNGEYEPYTSNTLSLPISTYFPTGMKDAGSAYDELTQTGYVKRINSHTFNSISNFDSSGKLGFLGDLLDAKPALSTQINIKSIYQTSTLGYLRSNDINGITQYQTGFYVRLQGKTTLAEYNEYLNSNPLTILYELATPTSQDISLDLTYPVYRGGTEQLLPVNGATPVTSALNAVIDYPYGIEETEFVYKQTTSTITLISGHSYITKINGTWSNVSGTGQTLTVSDDDMVIDLTQMANPYITNYAQFIQFYPESYEFEKGKLLSFTGESLKTVGFNQWDEVWENGTINVNNGSNVVNENNIRSKNYISCLPNTQYFFKCNDIAGNIFEYDENKNFIDVISSPALFTTKANAKYLRFYMGSAYGNTYNNDICINISDTSKNGQYEPYTESTLVLPTYDGGLKSAGNAYDELNESKYIKRIGVVDLGTLNWSYVSNDKRFIAIISDAKSSSSLTVLENIVSAKYENATWENILTQAKDKIISLHYTSNNNYVAVIDNDYSNATAFKQAMADQNVKLYYELATPIETELKTASLVCENGEAVAYPDEENLIIECNSEISSQSGIFPAKIKLQEGDDIAYSSLIKLIVEEKPNDNTIL